MEESETLQSALNDSINAWCSRDGGFHTGFVYCVARIDSEGQQVLTLGSGESQLTATSLGLASYLRKNFEMDVEFELSNYTFAEDEDD